MSKAVEVYDYMNVIIGALKSGVLLTTCSEGKVNSMAIAWGQIGIEWNRLIFTAFIRTGRFTYEQLTKNPEFTVNIPLAGMKVGEYIRVCGAKCGRDCDKLALAGLETVPGMQISVPGLRQLPLTLECKVVYRQLQDKAGISTDFQERFYPEDVPGSFSGSNQDYHKMFFGEIVGAYIAE